MNIPFLEVTVIVAVFMVFFVFGIRLFWNRAGKESWRLSDKDKKKLKKHGLSYMENVKKSLIEEEGFMDIKEAFPSVELTEEDLFEEFFVKKEGLTISFCTFLPGDELNLIQIEDLMKDYGELLQKEIENKNLPAEKKLIRGSAVLVFSELCSNRKKEMIARIEFKDIKNRIHLVPVVVDMELGEVYPSSEGSSDYYPDYSPGRTFLEEKIPVRKLSRVRERFLEDYKNQDSDLEKMEKIRSAIGKNRPYVTWVLLFLNIFMWLLMESHGGSENMQVLMNFGANERLSLWQGEYWRLIASVFIHIGFFHLLGNCLFLYLCGPLLELTYGHEKFLLIYILSGFAGSSVSALGMKLTPDIMGVSAGASGALFGVMGALVSFTIMERKNLPGRLYNALVINLSLLVAMNILISLIIPNIDILAHLGGLLAGFALGYMIEADIFAGSKNMRNKKIMTIVSVLFLALLTVTSLMALTPPRNLPYYLAINYFKNKDYDSAGKEFKKAVEIEPEKADIHLKLGIICLAENEPDRAIKELEEALKLEPNNCQANFFLALSYHERGDSEKAVEYYKKAIDNDSKFAPAYEGLADLYRVEKKWDLSEEYAKKAIDANFLLPSAHSSLGWIYLYQQKLEEAEEEFEIAMNLSVNTDFKAHIGQIAISSYRGDFDTSLSQVQKLKKLEDYRYIAYIIESDIYILKGEFEKAIEKAKAAIDLEPLSYYPHLYLAKAYFSSDKPVEAMPFIAKAVELDCKEPYAYEMLAVIYKENGELDRALLEYSSDETPIKKESFKDLALANCYYYKGDLDSSYGYVENVLTEDSSLLEGYILEAYIYYNQGEIRKAIDAISKAREIDPYDDRLSYTMAYFLFRQGKDREAIKKFASIKDLSNPLTHCARAFEYYINKDYDRAKEQADLSLKSGDKNAEGHLILGMIAEEKGDILNALSHYKIVLEGDPHRIEVKERLKKLKENKILIFFPLTTSRLP